jgi:hypothetical protein
MSPLCSEKWGQFSWHIMGLMTEKSWFDPDSGNTFFSCPERTERLRGPPRQWIPVAVSLRVKRPGREVDQRTEISGPLPPLRLMTSCHYNVITSNAARSFQWRMHYFSTQSSSTSMRSSHIGTSHNTEQLEIPLRKWMRTQEEVFYRDGELVQV